METIAKVIKAIFFDVDSVNRTAISHLKDYIVGIVLGVIISIVAIFYIADDEEDVDQVTTEQYEDD